MSNLELFPETEHDSPNPIRVETALSRFPLHRLSRKGVVNIDLREKDNSGELTTRWEVSHNSKYGQPGPLAYKLDTLLINRKIEEAPRPVPRVIRLGSLRDICRGLGLNEGQATLNVKNALNQNALAGITTKTQYRKSDGTERTLEATFTRYSVVFTGEKLPDGQRANAVYIILNDVYMTIINGAMTRPLDYDYLKELSPAPQRFYEILSYQIYAALKHNLSGARLVYSFFCAHAPQTRHTDWERVRSQMNKVIRPHKESGYLSKVEYRSIEAEDGKPDWVMICQPGPKAKAEFIAFTRRGGPAVLEVSPSVKEPVVVSGVEAELVAKGITPTIATRLVSEHGEEYIRQKIEILEWEMEAKPGKVDDLAGWLYAAIRDNHAPPKTFVPKAERVRRVEVKQRKDREAANEKSRKALEDSRDRAEAKAVDTYWKGLTAVQQEELEVAAMAEAEPEMRKLAKSGPTRKMAMAIVRSNHIRKLLSAASESGSH